MRAIITAALAASITLASTNAYAQAKGDTVRVQDYPGVGNMLYRVAIAKGYCSQHDLICELKTIPSAPLGVQALLAKSIDLADAPVEVQVGAMIKGADLLAVHGVAADNAFLLVVRQDLPSPIQETGFPGFMQALKGLKIGVTARGAAPEYLMTFLALKAGLKPEDFTFVTVGAPNTAYPALISKQVDAVMTFEPAGAMCEVLKTCRVVYRIATAKAPPELVATNGGATNMVAMRDFIEAKPTMIEALIAATRKAQIFLQDPANFEESLKIAQQFSRIEMPQGEEIMRTALRNILPAYRSTIDRAAVKAITDYMYASKQIDSPFDSTRVVYAKAP